MMALSIFRQLATFRPVGFLGQNSAKMGSIRCHNSSETSQIVSSGWRRGFRRAMTQTPVVVTGNGFCSLQAPLCKRRSSGSRIVSKGLIARSERGELTRDELAEYQALAQEVQRLDVARVEALAELARRRGKSVRAVKTEIGGEGSSDGA
jgi:hypothetical protein